MFAIAAVKRWISATSAAAENTVRIARNLGIATREARQLEFVADAVGLSMAVIEDAAFEIKKRFGEIKVNKPFAELMKSLGITAGAAAGMSSVDLMFATLEKISQGPAADIEKSLDLAFGGGAAKGMSGLTRDAELLAKVLESSQKVRGIGSAGEEFQGMQVQVALLKSHLQAVSIEIAAKLLPYVAKLVDWFAANLDQILSIGAKVIAVGAAIWAIVKVVMALKAVWAAVGVVIAAMSAPVWIVVAAITAAVAAAAALYVYWEDIGGAISEAWDSLSKFGSMIGDFFGGGGNASRATGRAPSRAARGHSTVSNTSTSATTINNNITGITADQFESRLRAQQKRSARGSVGLRG